MTDEPEELDEPPAANARHEIFRYARSAETRIYYLRVVPGGAELWRDTNVVSDGPLSVMEGLFRSSEETAQFLEELRRALIAGGWREV